MPGVPLPPGMEQPISHGFARTERLERKIVQLGSLGQQPPITFTYPGLLATGIESPPYYPNRNLLIVTVRVSLLANASVDHVIEVRVDGSGIVQYTLPSGSNTVVSASAIVVGTGSYVTVKTITVADSNLSIELVAQ